MLVDLVPLALMIVFMKKNAITVTRKLLTHSAISVTPIFRGQQVKMSPASLSAVPGMGIDKDLLCDGCRRYLRRPSQVFLTAVARKK